MSILQWIFHLWRFFWFLSTWTWRFCFQASLKLHDFEMTYEYNKRYQNISITTFQVGEAWIFNATFLCNQKIPKARIHFKLSIPKTQNSTRFENTLVDTSVDLCQFVKIIKSELLSRNLLQLLVDCAVDSFACPFEAPIRMINCPGKLSTDLIL